MQETLEAALGANAAGLAIRRTNQALKPGYWTVCKSYLSDSRRRRIIEMTRDFTSARWRAKQRKSDSEEA